MLVLNNSYELATTYLQVFLLWMFCSELVLSFACIYFVVTGHFIPISGLSILRANLASTEKSAAGKGSLYLGDHDASGFCKHFVKYACFQLLSIVCFCSSFFFLFFCHKYTTSSALHYTLMVCYCHVTGDG